MDRIARLLVPGWSHARHGRPRRALVVSAGCVALLVLAVATPWLHSFAGLLSFLAVAVAGAAWCAWDARRMRAARPTRVSPAFATLLAAPPWTLLLAIVLFPAPVAGLQAFRIPREHTSNAPTILPGDRILVDRMPVRALARGDLVFFRAPEEPGRTWVRRVVAVSGDVVGAGPAGVTVNGAVAAAGPCEPYGPVTIGPGRCFVVGEDLAKSRDSRHFGPLRIDAIIGRPLYVFWADAWERIGRTPR